MNQVLVYTQRADFRSFLDAECLKIKECFPVFYDTFDEMETILSIFPKLDVLVVDAPTDAQDLARLAMFVKDKKDQITHILLVSDHDTPGFTKVFHSTDWSELLAHLKTILGDKQSIEGFVGIPIDCLIHFKMMPFPLFLNLSPGKFIKRIPAFEVMDVSVLESYRSRGVKELFFERRFGKDFANLLMNNMINRVEQEYDSPEKKEQATSEVFGTVRDIVASIGLKPRVIELCETLMNQVIEEVSKGKGIQAVSYLQNLRERPELDFNYRFVQLTSFIVTQILDGRSRAHKKDEVKTVVLAAFFSDMSLKKPEHVHYRHLKEISQLTDEEKEEIKWHASLSASMVELNKIGNAEAAVIIRQHHGDLYGTDIPVGIHNDLLDLSKCLMAGQELSYALLTQGEDKLWKVFAEVFKAYKGTPLEEYLSIFEGSFLNYVKEPA
ncbi:MAG: hypothetical protein ACJ76H_16920 [Bacteriovoracaceae bacterium]